ncbi:MAG: endonuclease/exonuclease/phosphatase family protein [Flavobacteriales bacterium]|nr:endonuclease/exonuclease/phosphatase family protein [Flavobacteriales bacterium]
MSAEERRRPSRLHLPMWWATLSVALLLLLTYLSVRISPVRFWPAAFLGIAFPYLALLNFIALAYWAVFRRKRMLVPVAVLLIGWAHHGDFLRLVPDRKGPAPIEGRTDFSVMSYNVRLFDLYNWSGNIRTRNEIFDLFATEAPDVLCLQEFYRSSEKGFFNTRDTLLKHFHWRHLHEEYTQERQQHHFGMATYSTFPIVGKGVIHFPDDLNNLCIWTDLAVGHDTIRVYNAHIASLRFGDEDYRFMQSLDRSVPRDSLKQAGKRILQRLRNGFIRRAPEVERIATHMRQSPHPVVFCGDLNDTPMSYGYRTLRGPLKDAFVESGSGLGHTYVGAFPSFRIDHILHAAPIRSWAFRTLPDELSDHRPITCRMRVER